MFATITDSETLFSGGQSVISITCNDIYFRLLDSNVNLQPLFTSTSDTENVRLCCVMSQPVTSEALKDFRNPLWIVSLKVSSEAPKDFRNPPWIISQVSLSEAPRTSESHIHFSQRFNIIQWILYKWNPSNWMNCCSSTGIYVKLSSIIHTIIN